MRDRLLHHAICRVLHPYFDQKFIHDSYSCRLEKGNHKAINRFREFTYVESKNHTKTIWVLKCDIKKFFASIDHASLLYVIVKHVEDQNVIWLLTKIIKSFETAPGKGLPLGNLTSQLLVNIYMNEFDQFVKRGLKIKYYIRFADDFVILSSNKMYLSIVYQYIVGFLENNLKLSLHLDKVFIKTFSSGVDFLGWVHFPKHRVLRTVTKRRMLKNLAANPSEESRASYLGLLKHGNTYELRQML